MTHIHVGAPSFVSVRPLIYGLMRNMHPQIRLAYAEPSNLARSIDMGQLDGALIPAIEYLRGVGTGLVDGPALVARPADGNITLLGRCPLAGVTRVAVDEFCRTPVTALRIVLAELHGAVPDLLVEKNIDDSWPDRYDAVLLCGDRALAQRSRALPDGIEAHSISRMWHELTATPLVTALWTYRLTSTVAQLTKALVASRNLGTQNLHRLAEGIAQTSQYASDDIRAYYADCWSYSLGETELAGLRALEEHAVRFDLLRVARLPQLLPR